MELFEGARSQREERRIEALLARFERVPIDETDFQTAGTLMRHHRASYGLDVVDALIAATAEHHWLDLAIAPRQAFPDDQGAEGGVLICGKDLTTAAPVSANAMQLDTAPSIRVDKD
jgi:hypothetical protein